MEKVQDYFKFYPGSNVCYQTADGMIFHKDSHARTHANSLKDHAVKKFKRGEGAAERSKEAPDDGLNAVAETAPDLTGEGAAEDGSAEDSSDAALQEQPQPATKVKKLIPKGKGQ